MEASSSIGIKDPGSTGANISPGRTGVGCLICTNNSGAAAYFQFFDAATTNVSLGTTTPTFVIAVPNGESGIVTPSVGEMLFVTRFSVFATTTIFGNTATSAGHHVAAFIN